MSGEMSGPVAWRRLRGSQLPPDGVSHATHVGPTEATATEQHVSYERLNGSLPD